jgi:hypothetical protein
MMKELLMALARLSPMPSMATKSSKEALERSEREVKCFARDSPAAFPAIEDNSSWLFNSSNPTLWPPDTAFEDRGEFTKDGILKEGEGETARGRLMVSR